MNVILSGLTQGSSVYDGLPSACLMGQEYRDLVSRWSMVTPETTWISGNISYGWHAGLKHKQNYSGVTAALHGADLTEISYGDGQTREAVAHYDYCVDLLRTETGVTPPGEMTALIEDVRQTPVAVEGVVSLYKSAKS